MAASGTDKFAHVISGTTRPVATTLSAQKIAGATSFTVVATTGWDTDTAVHGIMYRTDASGAKTAGSQIDWKGTVSGTTISNVTVTAGTDDTYAIGTTVELSPTAAWGDDLVTGILQDHSNPSGNHKSLHDENGEDWIKQTATASAVNEITVANAATGNAPVISATGDDSNIGLTLTPKGTGGVTITKRFDGWTTGVTTPNTVTANGNRSYDLVFNSVDLTSSLSNGMRLRTTRTVAAPTQCTDLEAGSSQYYSKSSPAGMTFTDDFVVSAWVKLESYAAGTIASRYNGTSGWIFQVNASGQLTLTGYNAGAGNARQVISYQSVPLNKWVHVTAQLDMSAYTVTTTTCYVMIDGLDVPASLVQAGTNPTALIQAGDLQIGAQNGSVFFDGKLAQVAIYSAKVTQATIKASMTQTLSGSETSLISAYSFNNSINDLNANANNLTANGSAAATNADTPFTQIQTGVTTGTTNYGIITAVSFSTNTTVTLQVPEGDTIPTSGGISSFSYSTQKAPYGFPANADKWRVNFLWKAQTAGASNATFAAFTGMQFIVPTGAWDVGYSASFFTTAQVLAYWNLNNVAQTGLAATTSDLTMQTATVGPVAGATCSFPSYVKNSFALSAAATFVMYTLQASTSYGVLGSTSGCEFFAEFNLL